MSSLKGRTLFITGASRGIGKAIALRCAREGANIIIAAKTLESREKLKGSIFDAAREVEAAGGKALAVQVDVRDADQIARAVEQAVVTFGGIDVLVNNAGAIMLAPVEAVPVRRIDLMTAINFRAPLVCAQLCIPHLKKSPNGHIVNLSPPIDLIPRWFAGHTPYTMTKFGMSMMTLGLAEELQSDGVAVNSIWPRTFIGTAAVEMLGGEAMMAVSRTPEIVADAVYAIITTPSRERTGQWLIDEEVLRAIGVSDFEKYAVVPGSEPANDLYVG